MFPDVASEQGFAFSAGDGFAHDRIVLVGGGDDFEFAVVDDEPGPTAAETAEARGFELFFEGVEAAEGGFDVVGEFSGGRAAGVWGENLPEEGMIGVTAAVVANGPTNVVGDSGEIF